MWGFVFYLCKEQDSEMGLKSDSDAHSAIQ